MIASSFAKDRMVRSMSGLLILLALIIQKISGFDSTWFILLIGFNLFQYGLSGYCPVANYFSKIGWLQKI